MHEVITEQTRSMESELSDDDKETLIAGWKLLAEHIVEQMRIGFYFKTKAK